MAASDTSSAPLPARAEAGAAADTLRKLVAEIARQGDFPAVSRFLNDALGALRSPNATTHAIANLILKDLALTNGILRLVNSAYYRQSAHQQIATISRAVLVLGVDAVANLAMGLNLFEHFNGRNDIQDLKRLTLVSLLTGLHAREVAGGVSAVHPEEAFVGGVLHDLGHLVLTFYLPDRRAAVDRLRGEGAGEEEAWQRVLGVAPSDLGQAVARAWNLPDDVCGAVGAVDGTSDGRPVTSGQRLRAVVGLARGLTAAAALADDGERAAALQALRDRWGETLALRPKQLERALATSAERLGDLTLALRISRREMELHAPAALAARAPAPATPAHPEPRGVATAEAAPLAAVEEGTGEQRQGLLVHSMEEIAHALTRSYALNDVFMMILEGMYRGVGAEHVVLALLAPDRTRLRGRFGLGPRAQDIVARLDVALDEAAGPLAQVIRGPAELVVPDTADAAAGVPADFLALVDAGSFMLLPIVIGTAAIGAFYVGRTTAQGSITPAEQRSLRALTNYAVLAVRQSRTR
jgi:HD-like signal output (HDOD) protein